MTASSSFRLILRNDIEFDKGTSNLCHDSEHSRLSFLSLPELEQDREGEREKEWERERERYLRWETSMMVFSLDKMFGLYVDFCLREYKTNYCLK